MNLISLLFMIFIKLLCIKPASVIKLRNFQKTYFNLGDEYIILEYSNDVEMKFGGGSIFFIFDTGNRPSTNVFLYESFDKIKKGDSGFINYLDKTTLKDTKYIEINSKSQVFKEKITYYLVLYDINEKYYDYIYIVNTLDYFPLYDNQYLYFKQTIDPQLNFNLIIPKNSYGYFHYQTTKNPINVLGTSDFYYFRIKDSGGTTYIDEQTSGVNNYIKLKPELEYYIQIAIRKSQLFEATSSFILSFSEYGENYLIKDDNIDLDILSSQHFSFFKNISDLNISDYIIFNGNINLGFCADSHFYIKYYDSDNFELLHESFPSSSGEFDKEIENYRYGEFQVKIKKTYNSQKGILLGIFFDSQFCMMERSYLTIYGLSKNKEDENKENDKRNDDNNAKDYKDKDADDDIWIELIIIIVILIILVIYFKKHCKNSSSYSSSSSTYNRDVDINIINIDTIYES